VSDDYIATMLKNFPPGASWEGDDSMCRMAPPGDPRNCHGRICRANRLSKAMQQVILFIRTRGFTNDSVLLDSPTPYEALMQVRAVREYVAQMDRAAQSALKKALRKKVRAKRLKTAIEPDLTPEGIVQAQLRAQSLEEDRAQLRVLDGLWAAAFDEGEPVESFSVNVR